MDIYGSGSIGDDMKFSKIPYTFVGHEESDLCSIKERFHYT